MTNVPISDVLIYIATIPAGLCLVLIAIVFVELRGMRKTINETNGLYKVMLDYVAAELSEPEDDDAGSR